MGCPNSSQCYSVKDKPYFQAHVRTHVSRRFSNNVLIASVVAVSTFTSVTLLMIWSGKAEIPQWLGIAWFGFWGTEIITLASITRRKIKAGINDKKDMESEEQENGE